MARLKFCTKVTNFCYLSFFYTFARLSGIAGDFNKTPFPKVDLFIIARVLRNMKQNELDNFMSKCFQSLNPGTNHYYNS